VRAGRAVGARVLGAGKLVTKGIGGKIGKGIRSLDDFARRLWSKVRFRKFKIRRRGKRLELFGYLNPWVLLANGTVEWKEVDGPYEVGDLIKVAGSKQKGIIVGKRGRPGVPDVTPSKYVEDLQNLSKAKARARYDELRAAGRTGRRELIAGVGETSRHAKELRQSMQANRKVLKEGEHAHHIVPSTHPRAKAARKVLDDAGVEVNSHWNGAALKEDIHGPLHTNRYIDAVTTRLLGAKSKADVIAALTEIELLIKARKFPP
jgi:hypothetical protein